MPTYRHDGLAWTYSGRFGECLDDFEIDRDECDEAALAAYDAMAEMERESLEESAVWDAWHEDRDDARTEAGLARRGYREY